MLYGVESGNQQILDTVKKKITLEKIREGVRLAKEAGIEVMASFIIGLPGETRETLQENIEFGLSLDTSWGFNVLSPFPGTEVRERAQEYGLEILTNDWTKYDANTAVSRTEGAGPDEIAEALSQYNKTLEGFLEDMEKQGRLDPSLVTESRIRSPLAWTLLQDDVVDNLGYMEMRGDPVVSLVNRLKDLVPYSFEHINENVRKWVDEGLLTYDLKDERLSWRWS